MAEVSHVWQQTLDVPGVDAEVEVELVRRRKAVPVVKHQRCGQLVMRTYHRDRYDKRTSTGLEVLLDPEPSRFGQWFLTTGKTAFPRREDDPDGLYYEEHRCLGFKPAS